MDRRGFLKWLGGAAIGTAAAIAVPELWTPSRTIFLPPKGGWGGNSLLTMQQITEEALRILHQQMQFRTVRQYVINNDPLPIRVEGAYMNVRRPPRYHLNRIVESWS